jgi:hypothetical protein
LAATQTTIAAAAATPPISTLLKIFTRGRYFNLSEGGTPIPSTVTRSGQTADFPGTRVDNTFVRRQEDAR